MPFAPAIQRLLAEGALVDPETLNPLRPSVDGLWLLNDMDGRRFPVVDGVPRLTLPAAEPLPAPTEPIG